MILLSKYIGVIYIATLVVVLPVIAYNTTISKTLDNFIKHKELEAELAYARSSSYSRTDVAGENIVDSLSHEMLLGDIIKLTQGGRVVIEKYTPYVTDDQDGICAQTVEINLRGDYISNVRLIDKIERELKKCKIVSASFKGDKKRETTDMMLIIQYIQTK